MSPFVGIAIGAARGMLRVMMGSSVAALLKIGSLAAALIRSLIEGVTETASTADEASLGAALAFVRRQNANRIANSYLTLRPVSCPSD
jgi:LytS/YehU family sensor histidine kinase